MACWACFLSLAQSKLRICLANQRAGYFSNLACDWLSIVWAYSEQETENGPWSRCPGPDLLIQGIRARQLLCQGIWARCMGYSTQTSKWQWDYWPRTPNLGNRDGPYWPRGSFHTWFISSSYNNSFCSIFIKMVPSGHNFAQAIRAVLSCHVQNCGLILRLFFIW